MQNPSLSLIIYGIFQCGLIVAAPIEVNKWFPPEQRSTANGLVFTGSCIGGLYIGPSLVGISTATTWKTSLVYLSIFQVLILLIASILLKTPPNQQEIKTRASFSEIWKYPLFKIYLLMQAFYCIWRSGYFVYLIDYAETSKGYPAQKAAFLLTIEALAETFGRPSVARFAEGKSRYKILAVLYFIQAIFTATQPWCDVYRAGFKKF